MPRKNAGVEETRGTMFILFLIKSDVYYKYLTLKLKSATVPSAIICFLKMISSELFRRYTFLKIFSLFIGINYTRKRREGREGKRDENIVDKQRKTNVNSGSNVVRIKALTF